MAGISALMAGNEKTDDHRHYRRNSKLRNNTVQKDEKITINDFIEALEKLKGRVPDVLAASLVAFTCREDIGVVEVQESDVISLAKGLQVIVPDLVGVDDDKIAVHASASHVASAVRSQIEGLHGEADDGE